jgi:hypothetical protein
VNLVIEEDCWKKCQINRQCSAISFITKEFSIDNYGCFLFKDNYSQQIENKWVSIFKVNKYDEEIKEFVAEKRLDTKFSNHYIEIQVKTEKECWVECNKDVQCMGV